MEIFLFFLPFFQQSGRKKCTNAMWLMPYGERLLEDEVEGVYFD